MKTETLLWINRLDKCTERISLKIVSKNKSRLLKQKKHSWLIICRSWDWISSYKVKRFTYHSSMNGKNVSSNKVLRPSITWPNLFHLRCLLTCINHGSHSNLSVELAITHLEATRQACWKYLDSMFNGTTIYHFYSKCAKPQSRGPSSCSRKMKLSKRELKFSIRLLLSTKKKKMKDVG